MSGENEGVMMQHERKMLQSQPQGRLLDLNMEHKELIIHYKHMYTYSVFYTKVLKETHT